MYMGKYVNFNRNMKKFFVLNILNVRKINSPKDIQFFNL